MPRNSVWRRRAVGRVPPVARWDVPRWLGFVSFESERYSGVPSVVLPAPKAVLG